MGGTWRMFLIFNSGVLGGALLHMYAHCHAFPGLTGMSGGCYSLMGFFLANLLMNWQRVRFRALKLLVITAVICVDFINYKFFRDKVDGYRDTNGTSHSSHIGGSIAGLLVGIALGNNVVHRKCELFLKVM